MIKSIPLSFIRDRARLTWGEAAWGYHQKHLSWRDAIELACDCVIDGNIDSCVLELAGTSKSEAHQVGELLDKLAANSGVLDEACAKAKWLYLILAWLFENRTTDIDALEAVEMIYADFDYPEEVAPFIRYMPVSDGYDPNVHTSNENQSRLMGKWANYLAVSAKVFSPRSDLPR